MIQILVFLLGCTLVRGELYKFSDAYIDQINREADTWTAGRNFPANLTEEYLRQFLIADAKYFDQSDRPLPGDRKTYDPEYSATVPDRFDAREQWPNCGTIGHVPDTGACAAPQIFAAVGAFSDRRCIKSKGQQNRLLSTEYVASCCKICRYDDNKSCSHGSVFRTWNFLHKRGSVTGGDYGDRTGCQPSTISPCSHHGSAPTLPSCENQKVPKLKCHTRCTNPTYGRGFFQDKHRTTLTYWVDDNEDAIKKEILAHGPTTATFVLYDDFYHYKSGVYKHTSSAKLENYLHSGKLIGWGTENGTPYWLVINTWGPHWGDRGTVKILRGKYECAFEYLIAAGKPKN
ncbi:hypothetical protein M8J77_023361 [Diaphorina citri]|nr:hypothetical protein M8J77_023361 [Diaphorina citri]